MSLYPALTQTKFDSYLENSIQHDNPFEKIRYTEKVFENPSNFKNYVKASRATKPIVDELGNIHQGFTYWSEAEFDGFTLPAQGREKDYCKKWVSYGCGNIKQHPNNQHYAQHELKSCKTRSCPLCWVDWVNRQANRSTRRFMKFTEDKQYNFRRIRRPHRHVVAGVFCHGRVCRVDQSLALHVEVSLCLFCCAFTTLAFGSACRRASTAVVIFKVN